MTAREVARLSDRLNMYRNEREGGGGALLWPKRTGLAVCGLEVPSFHGSVWFLVGNGGMDYAIGTTIRIHSPIPY